MSNAAIVDQAQEAEHIFRKRLFSTWTWPPAPSDSSSPSPGNHGIKGFHGAE